MQNTDVKWPLASAYILYFYLLYWPYISEDVFREKEKDILPKGWRNVLLPILEDSIGFSWFSGWELQYLIY